MFRNNSGSEHRKDKETNTLDRYHPIIISSQMEDVYQMKTSYNKQESENNIKIDKHRLLNEFLSSFWSTKQSI